MERENRYLVIKRAELRAALLLMTPDAKSAFLATCEMVEKVRSGRGKQPLCCIVVESDWPEYEPTWAAIEKRVDGGL